MSDLTARGIRVGAESFHIPERSRPDQDYYFFAYQVTISNLGSETAQLLSRRRIITNAEGRVETVQGPGVVGKQPVLKPVIPSSTRASALWTHRLGPCMEGTG